MSLLFSTLILCTEQDKLNQAADTLSHHPKINNDNSGDSESEEYETMSYTVGCDDLCEVIKGEKLPLDH